MNTRTEKRAGRRSPWAQAAVFVLGASMVLTSFAPYLALADDAVPSAGDTAPASNQAASADPAAPAQLPADSGGDVTGQATDPAAIQTPAAAVPDATDLASTSDPAAPVPTAAAPDPTTATNAPTSSTDTSVPTPGGPGSGAHHVAEGDVVTPGTSVAPPSLAPEADRQLVPQVDTVTGALNYAYPIALPQGKSGMTPDLKLLYSSQEISDVSEVGYGWSISIPYIERGDRYGTDQLYTGTHQDFSSSFDGELVQSASAGTANPDEGTYGAKSDKGDFSSYV